MTSRQTWQERIDVLAYGEVQPLLFATDVERREKLVVHVVLIDASPTNEQVMLMRQETIAQFSSRLRALLSEPPG